MALDKEALSSSLRDLENLKKQHEQELSQRKFNIYNEIPRIHIIDRTLQQTAAAVMRVALESEYDPAEAIEKLKNQNLELQNEKKRLLIENGFPSNYLSLELDCKICSDIGYVGTKMCECLKKRYAKKLTENLSVVLPIQHQNFTSFNINYYPLSTDARTGICPRDVMEHNFTFCQKYALNFSENSENILLYGAPGLGKTFLSTSIAKVVSERGFSVAYDTSISILGHYESQKFGNFQSDESQKHINKYRNSDLFIIDDLGSEMSTNFTTSAIYDIVNYRIMARKPMIINTNLIPIKIQERYSEAIASRMLGEFTQLRFMGNDIRAVKRNRNL